MRARLVILTMTTSGCTCACTTWCSTASRSTGCSCPSWPGLPRLAGRGDGPLVEPPLQYGDFAYWQRRNADEAGAAGAGAILASGSPGRRTRSRSRRIVPPAPPSSSPRPGALRASPRPTAPVRSTAREQQAPSSCSCSRASPPPCHRRCGQTDLVIGSVSGGRDRPELERLIGYFLRMLVMRIDLGGGRRFASCSPGSGNSASRPSATMRCPFSGSFGRSRPHGILVGVRSSR